MAVFDSIGGLALARCLSLAFMMSATLLLWSTTKRLYDASAAFYACVLFVLVGTAQDLGAFADYDAMAIFCTALAFWLGVRAVYARYAVARGVLYACVGLVLVLADAAKYASGLWNPFVLAGISALAWRQRGRIGYAYGPFAAMFVPLALGICGALKLGGPSYVQGVLFTTVNRQLKSDPQPISTVLWLGFTYIWIIVLLCIAATVLHLRATWPDRLFFAVLTAAVLAAPVNQARISTYASLYKHVVFGAWFGAIAAGWLISRAEMVPRTRPWRIGAAILAVAFLAGYGQGTTQFHSWPDTAPVVQELGTILTQQTGPVAFVTINNMRWADYYLISQASPSRLDAVSASSALAQLGRGYYAYIDIDTWSPLPGTTDVDHAQASADRSDEALEAAISTRRDYRLIYTTHWKDAWYAGESRIWQYVGGSR